MSNFALIGVSLAANFLVGMLTPKPKTQGDKVKKDAPSADYNTPVPLGIGRFSAQGTIIWAKPLKVKKKKKRGKGGAGASGNQKYYYASYAVLVAQTGSKSFPLSTSGYRLKSLKLNDTLFYEDNNSRYASKTKYFTFYPGTYTQPIDPTIAADFADTSAYRGCCYIVFKDLPVEQYGNTFPSVTVVLEAVNQPTCALTDVLSYTLRLAKASAGSYASTLTDTKRTNINVEIENNYSYTGYVFPFSGETYKSHIEQTAQLEIMGKVSLLNNDRSEPHNSMIIKSLSTVESTVFDLNPDKLGAAEGDRYGTKFEIDTKDFAELPNSVQIQYNDTAKDFNQGNISLTYPYYAEFQQSINSQSIDLNYAINQGQALEIGKRVLSQMYDRNRTLKIALSAEYLGQFDLSSIVYIRLDDSYTNAVPYQVVRLAIGADYTTELTLTLFTSTANTTNNTSGTVDVSLDPPSAEDQLATIVAIELADTTLQDVGNPVNYFVALKSLSVGNTPSPAHTVFYRLNSGAWLETGVALEDVHTVATITAADLQLSTTPGLIDYESTLTVQLIRTDYSLMAIAQDEFEVRLSNLLLLPTGELICYRDATLVAANTYQLKTFYRGLRNTRQYMAAAIANTDCIILDENGVAAQALRLPASISGVSIQFAAVVDDELLTEVPIAPAAPASLRSVTPDLVTDINSILTSDGSRQITWYQSEIWSNAWSDNADQPTSALGIYFNLEFLDAASSVVLAANGVLTNTYTLPAAYTNVTQVRIRQGNALKLGLPVTKTI